MHGNTLKFRANRQRILAVAPRIIAEVGFAHFTVRHLMADGSFCAGSLRNHFPHTTDLLAVVCERHANALLEATGCVEPDDPRPPRAVLVASAARVLACIDANPTPTSS